MKRKRFLLIERGSQTSVTEEEQKLSQVEKDIEPDLQQDQASQQSSCVHTLVHPNQPQADVEHVSIGHHSAVFLAPATGITVNQNITENVTGTTDQDQVQAVAQKAKEALKNRYTTTGSYVQMLPWVDDDKKHIMDIYTKLCLVEQVQRKKNKTETHKKMSLSETRMKSYEEIFHFETREGNPIKRVIISGSAGVGKTTLIDKIAYDWALGKIETLNKYELVFVLKMCSLNQTSDLMDAIFDQLLGKDSADKCVLEEFIDKNQDKLLILLDGFDEFKSNTLDKFSFGSILKVLNRKQGTEYWVVITSRPPLHKLVNSSMVEKPFTHATVEGFSDTDIKEYVNKFFPNDHDKTSKLLEQIKLSNTLSDLAKSPMLLLLMCLLGNAENTLPDTMTRLYQNALRYIFKRKQRDIKEDAICKSLIAIGKVALDRLISTDQSFAFRKEDFKTIALADAMSAGVITSERVINGLDTYQSVSFIHHTLLEYCAAMYWQSLLNTKEFDRILHQINVELTESTTLAHRMSRYDFLLRFCCGDNKACTNRILTVLKDIDLRLAMICYFESQSEEPPPENVISSVLTDNIEIDDWNNDSTNALFYFLKGVKVLSRGHDYFTKVKKLVLEDFNFHRFGEDLAESMKLMTNLQFLSLQRSSVTNYANTTLSSLARSSTLAELVLSHNDALGGSASLWALHLKKMNHLNKLTMEGCNLTDGDIEPIAESVSDMPELVHLKLSLNGALGGHASLWALHLKKMNHLNKLTMEGCNLTDSDIEPIAESVSGMPKLIHLILSHNFGLGGKASMWALHLKKMNHLKELRLAMCNLKVCDMEPIAESVSDMPELINLDLSYNKALGGHASLWALHLKKMNHLNELRLEWCNLKDGDMEPLAESVSDMPELVNLDLSYNKALGGHASLWAPQLKQMTKHLKKLKIYGLTHEDQEHITASVGLSLSILDFTPSSDSFL